jgi:tetratricopeptide (TPR) repeat protein
MIPTTRHLQFASGYLALGMLNEATEEMALIPPQDWARPEILTVRIDLHSAKKEWGMVVGYGEQLARRYPKKAEGWVSWAFALRELGRIEEAKVVLLEAEPIHGRKCALLRYNLACYCCLLGDQVAAKAWLSRACKMDSKLKESALDDEDLKAMWDDIAAMK